MGIDTEHGPHGELHPVFVFTVRSPTFLAIPDTWAIFIRNWGNEGACGGSQHYLDLTQFTLPFKAPPGAENATSVLESPQTNFDAGSENGSNFSGFTRSRLSPLQHDAKGKPFAEMTFTIGPPEQHTFIDGSLSFTWMCGNNECPQSPATHKPPPSEPAPSLSEGDALPGANLLSKDQVSQLQKQFASHGPRTTAQPVAVVPFATPTSQVFNPGQGSLTDRTVADPARQQRMVDVQKSICKTLANNPQRPSICSSLP